MKRSGGLQRKTPLWSAKIRQLRPGDPVPDGEPRRYTSDSRGYVRLRWKVGPGEYIETYEHRLVAGMPDAEVHHGNDDKSDNSPENLHVLSKAEHAREHGAHKARASKRVTLWDGHRSQFSYERHRKAQLRQQERREFLAEVVRRYRAGESTTVIADAMGKTAGTISRALRQAGVAPRRPGRGGPAVVPTTRQIVHGRAEMRCERCSKNLVWGGGEIHHRRPRGSGGSRAGDTNLASNLLLLCLACHAWIESFRTAALEAGLLLKSGSVPSRVPVTLARGTVLLDDKGGWA